MNIDCNSNKKYECKYCKINFKKKYNLDQHNKRKKSCIKQMITMNVHIAKKHLH